MDCLWIHNGWVYIYKNIVCENYLYKQSKHLNVVKQSYKNSCGFVFAWFGRSNQYSGIIIEYKFTKS